MTQLVDNSGQWVPNYGPGPVPYVHQDVPPIPYVPDNNGYYVGPPAPPYVDGNFKPFT
jgi:hypothetical protein